MFSKIALCVAFSGLATTAVAQNYEVRNDVQLWSAVEQMSAGLGTGCQLGDQTGCQGYQYVQNVAGYLVATNDACLYQNDQQACQFFQQAYNDLDVNYGHYLQGYAPQLQAAMAGNNQQLYNPMGATHQERMNNINNWGQQMLANGQAHSQMMEDNHQEFLRTIRE